MKNNTTYKLTRLLNEMYFTVNCNYIHIIENRFRYIYLYVLENCEIKLYTSTSTVRIILCI